MTRTIHVAVNDIAHFVVVFICVLMTYACVGHFMYVSFARRGAKSSARRFCVWLFASLARCHDDDRHNGRHVRHTNDGGRHGHGSRHADKRHSCDNDDRRDDDRRLRAPSVCGCSREWGLRHNVPGPLLQQHQRRAAQSDKRAVSRHVRRL